MSKELVGGVPGSLLGTLADILTKVRDGSLTEDELKLFAKRQNPFAAVAESFTQILTRARRVIRKMFGRGLVVSVPPPSVTLELLARAARYNLRLVYLPFAQITPEKHPKGWITPSAWFYQQVAANKVKAVNDLHPTLLPGCWCLADFTASTDYTDGSQVWRNDPWSELITQLRAQGKVGKYDNTPVGSRYAITPDEWDKVVLPAIAQELGVPVAQVRMERAVEFNAIGNLYDSKRGKFNSWEWFADPFEGSFRLCGGSRVRGGLAFVDYGWSDDRDVSIAARPLVSFGS